MLYTALYMPALRTQIYLTREQRERLDGLVESERRPLAALIRDAVDEYLDHSAPDPAASLKATFGVAPDFAVPSRSEWEERDRRIRNG
jgi:hypothetical protein